MINEERLMFSWSHTLSLMYSRSLPAGGYVTHQLTEDDAATVHAAWDYGTSPETISVLAWLIRVFPSLAVKDASGRVVAGMLTYNNGSMGALWVDAEHRRRGLAKYIVTGLAIKLTGCGMKAFVNIKSDNTMSIGLHVKCGFRQVGDVKTVFFRQQPANVPFALF